VIQSTIYLQSTVIVAKVEPGILKLELSCHILEIPPVEGARREEAFCCFEVARAQQKAQLVGWGAKLIREATQFGWEIKILFALDTVENRWRFEGLAFHRIEDVHPGHDGSPVETAHLTRVCRRMPCIFGWWSEETVCGGRGERGQSRGRTAKNGLGLATEQSPILSDGTLGVNWRGINRKRAGGGRRVLSRCLRIRGLDGLIFRSR
jgi:hypothetical protein